MFSRIRKTWAEGRKGTIVVLVAVTGTVMFGFTAMTIDLGTIYVAQTELQRAADAAALAAVAKLTHYTAGVSENDAKTEAERIVEANPVQGHTFKLDTSKDVVFGHAVWDNTAQKYTFATGGTVPTAVRVYVRMTKDSPNGSMKTMFSSVLGVVSKDMAAKAAAMIVPRDISVVADLSGSMNDDSELQNYKQIGVNLWNIWACLPVQRGSNGTGDGWNAPGNAPAVDQTGRMYMTPTASVKGPVFGSMSTWGTLTLDSNYDPTKDAGLYYIPYGATSNDLNLAARLQAIGYCTNEINVIVKGTNDSSTYYPNRVQVALGLMRWDSGIAGGLWSKVGTKTTKSTNKDTKIDSSELTTLVSYPWSGGSWSDYINNYMRSTSSTMYTTNSKFQYRFGPKTLVNYLLESYPDHVSTSDLCNTPEQPVQAVKDAVSYCMDLITTQDSDDQVSLEIFAETAHHMSNLTKTYSAISSTLNGMQAGYYDSWTYTGGGIDLAISELTSTRARANAAKVIFLLSDGQANVTKAGATGDYTGGKSYALAEAQKAVNQGMQFYCVSMGVDADRPFMQQIAAMGGGEEFYAVGTIDQYSSQLKDIFAELGSKRPVRLIE